MIRYGYMVLIHTKGEAPHLKCYMERIREGAYRGLLRDLQGKNCEGVELHVYSYAEDGILKFVESERFMKEV
jgi:hypothetical protein